MSAALLGEIEQFLGTLEATQEELSKLFREKRAALINANTDQMLRLSGAENELSKRLTGVLGRRQGILSRAKQADLPCESLSKLAAAVTGQQREQLQQRIDRARQMSHELRQESWIHWIISHRTYCHYTELLNLIANSGEKPPTYGEGTNEHTTGGVILDASI